MTKAAHGLLLYLDRYLTQQDAAASELRKFHLEHTRKKLSPQLLWVHRKRKSEPNLSTSLVYLIFLNQKGEIVPAKKPGLLFTYKHPEWLK